MSEKNEIIQRLEQARNEALKNKKIENISPSDLEKISGANGKSVHLEFRKRF